MVSCLASCVAPRLGIAVRGFSSSLLALISSPSSCLVLWRFSFLGLLPCLRRSLWPLFRQLCFPNLLVASLKRIHLGSSATRIREAVKAEQLEFLPTHKMWMRRKPRSPTRSSSQRNPHAEVSTSSQLYSSQRHTNIYAVRVTNPHVTTH